MLDNPKVKGILNKCNIEPSEIKAMEEDLKEICARNIKEFEEGKKDSKKHIADGHNKGKNNKLTYVKKDSGVFGIITGATILTVAIIISTITAKGYALFLPGLGLGILFMLALCFALMLNILLA